MKRFVPLMLLIFPIVVFSQKQDNIWYFGGLFWDQSQPGAGLDFNTGTPVPLTNSAMSYTEGCASYCNSAGELLFYAKGDIVYDRTHNMMLNGDSMGGHWSTMQSTLIVPVTGDTNKYYLFTNDGLMTSNGTGLYYSIIDMSLNGGFGAVTTKAVHLLSQTSEQLTGTKHSNGSDFWVITTDFASCKYYAYQVTPTVVMPPVISDLGYTMDCLGHLIISTDGQKIVNVPFETQKRTFYSFDLNTGVVSNPVELTSLNMNGGCSFSPNGNLFYETSMPDTLIQYDLTSANIAATRTVVGFLGNGITPSMRIGPDDKIYVSTYSEYVDIIHNPNILGIGCNHQSNALYLNGRHSGWNFPNVSLIADPLTTVQEVNSNIDISVYPNPFNDFTVLGFSNPFNENIVLKILDTTGRVLRTMNNIKSESVIIKKEDLLPGVYFFKLIKGNVVVGSGEFVIK